MNMKSTYTLTRQGITPLGFRIVSYYSSFENPDFDFDRFFNRKSLVLILLIPAEIYFIPRPLYFNFVFLHLPNLLPTEAKVKGRGIIWQLSSVQCQSRHSYVLSVWWIPAVCLQSVRHSFQCERILVMENWCFTVSSRVVSVPARSMTGQCLAVTV